MKGEKTQFKDNNLSALKHGCHTLRSNLPPDKQEYLDKVSVVMTENVEQAGDLILVQRAVNKLRRLLLLDHYEANNPDMYEFPHDKFKIALDNSFRLDLTALCLTPKVKRELGLHKQGKDFFSWLDKKQIKGKANDDKQTQT